MSIKQFQDGDGVGFTIKGKNGELKTFKLALILNHERHGGSALQYAFITEDGAELHEGSLSGGNTGFGLSRHDNLLPVPGNSRFTVISKDLDEIKKLVALDLERQRVAEEARLQAKKERVDKINQLPTEYEVAQANGARFVVIRSLARMDYSSKVEVHLSCARIEPDGIRTHIYTRDYYRKDGVITRLLKKATYERASQLLGVALHQLDPEEVIKALKEKESEIQKTINSIT